MLEALNQYFFQALINSVAVIYVLSKLLNEKLNFKDYKIYLVLFLFVISGILNFIYVNSLIRLLTMTIVVFYGNYHLFKKSIKITLISSIFEQFIVVVSELFAFLFLMLFTNLDISQIRAIFYGNFCFVTLISLIMIILVNFKLVQKVYVSFLNNITYLNIRYLSIYSLIIVLSINLLIVGNFIEIGFQKLFIINLCFIIIYCIILYYALNKNNENIKFKLENEILIKNLNEYEKMLDYQRINNHEDKNQLLVIKSMVEKKNEKLIEYINEIIKEKREDNEILFSKTKRIPSGGLQGLIYQKMLLMQDNNIEVILDVSKNIRKIDFSNISSKMNYDICRIVGVILDNAIEETIKFNKNEREIVISMYVYDEYFYIEVSNRIKENIDINKIYDKSYTTKENGHGYGLSLLNKIVSENDKIINNIRIMNNIFTQIVKIKK